MMLINFMYLIHIHEAMYLRLIYPSLVLPVSASTGTTGFPYPLNFCVPEYPIFH